MIIYSQEKKVFLFKPFIYFQETKRNRKHSEFKLFNEFSVLQFFFHILIPNIFRFCVHTRQKRKVKKNVQYLYTCISIVIVSDTLT